LLKVYNPTYGKLFEFDEARPADPARVGGWVLNYASPDRGLTSAEIEELKTRGKISDYPDEFCLVDSTEWPLERTLRHQRAVKAFIQVNDNGEEFHYWNHLSNLNKRNRITLNFVPSPIVDMILQSSCDSAEEQVHRIIVNDAASEFRKKKTFQELAREHARKLVQAVRQANGTVSSANNSSPSVAHAPLQEKSSGKTTPPEESAAQKTSPIRQRILECLAETTAPVPPLEIANRTDLNRHTIRRELQELLRQGLVIRQEHNYALARKENEMECTTVDLMT